MAEAQRPHVEVDDGRLDSRLEQFEFQGGAGDGAGGEEYLVDALAVVERPDQQEQAGFLGQIGYASSECML